MSSGRPEERPSSSVRINPSKSEVKICTFSSRYRRRAATFPLERRGVFLRPRIEIVSLANLLFNFRLMIVVVGEGVIHLSWRELGELAQHFLYGEAKLRVPHEGTNRKASATNNWAPATLSLFTFDIRRVTCFESSRSTHTRSSVSDPTTCFQGSQTSGVPEVEVSSANPSKFFVAGWQVPSPAAYVGLSPQRK